jgi:hypothetical protein
MQFADTPVFKEAPRREMSGNGGINPLILNLGITL